MDILSLLMIFFIVATIIKIATDNVANMLQPFYDITPYKLIVAFALTVVGVFTLNIGVLESLNIPNNNASIWFKYFDLFLSSLFLTGGAQSIHKLSDAWINYKNDGKGVMDDDKKTDDI